MFDFIAILETKQVLYLMYKKMDKTITVRENKKLEKIMEDYSKLYESEEMNKI